MDYITYTIRHMDVDGSTDYTIRKGSALILTTADAADAIGCDRHDITITSVHAATNTVYVWDRNNV